MIDVSKPIQIYDVGGDGPLYNVFEVLWSNDRVAVVTVPYGIFRTEVMINIHNGIVYGDQDFYRFYTAKNVENDDESVSI